VYYASNKRGEHNMKNIVPSDEQYDQICVIIGDELEVATEAAEETACSLDGVGKKHAELHDYMLMVKSLVQVLEAS
jgi:hypothetical protein